MERAYRQEATTREEGAVGAAGQPDRYREGTGRGWKKQTGPPTPTRGETQNTPVGEIPTGASFSFFSPGDRSESDGLR